MLLQSFVLVNCIVWESFYFAVGSYKFVENLGFIPLLPLLTLSWRECIFRLGSVKASIVEDTLCFCQLVLSVTRVGFTLILLVVIRPFTVFATSFKSLVLAPLKAWMARALAVVCYLVSLVFSMAFPPCWLLGWLGFWFE